MSPLLKTLLAGAFLILFSGFVQASLVVNGGFENAQPQDSGNNPKGIHSGGNAAYANSVSVVSLNEWTDYTAPFPNDDVPLHYLGRGEPSSVYALIVLGLVVFGPVMANWLKRSIRRVVS